MVLLVILYEKERDSSMAPISHVLQMFGHSPIRPLQTHMAKAYACVELLLPFFEAVLATNWPGAEALQQQIATLEREADDLKKEFRTRLPKNLFSPVSRPELLAVLTIQDELPNQAKDIAGLVLGRHMQIPAPISQQFLAFVTKCLETVKMAEHAINELNELLESGFHGNEIKIMEKMIIELDDIEHATDKMEIEIRAILFKLEKNLPPVDVMFLYKIVEWTGALADHAHNLGGQLYLVLGR